MQTCHDNPRARRIAGLLAGHAVAALIDEATLAPKPGLVDIRGQGAHEDLDWSLMCLSACTLQPTFRAFVHAAQSIRDTRRLRERIGVLGRGGEADMMRATGGVNTHRGAIWALGLLVTSAARVDSWSPECVAEAAGVLACVPDPMAPRHTGNRGETARKMFGVGGAVAQAQAGFPHVLQHALPALSLSRVRGHSESAARLNALLATMSTLDDTCVLARGGAAALTLVQAGAQRVLEAGGAGTIEGRVVMRELDQQMIARNLSPGGSADLLAATLFLDRLSTGWQPLSASPVREHTQWKL